MVLIKECAGKTAAEQKKLILRLKEICDQIGIIDKGKLVYAGSIPKFKGRKTLEEKFVEVISAKQVNKPKTKSSKFK